MELVLVNPPLGGIPSRGVSVSKTFAYHRRSSKRGFVWCGNVGRAVPSHRLVNATGGKQAELLEKELTFEPMFDGYLKAMETLKDDLVRNSFGQMDLNGSSRSHKVRRSKQLMSKNFKPRREGRGIEEVSSESPNIRFVSRSSVESRASMEKQAHRVGKEAGVLKRNSYKRRGNYSGLEKVTGSTGVPTKSTVDYAHKLGKSENGRLRHMGNSGNVSVVDWEAVSSQIIGHMNPGGDTKKERQITETHLMKQVYGQGRTASKSGIGHGASNMTLGGERVRTNHESSHKHEILSDMMKIGSKEEKVKPKPSDGERLASANSSILRDSYIEAEQHPLEQNARATVSNSCYNVERVANKNSNLRDRICGSEMSRNEETKIPVKAPKNMVPYDSMDTERAAFRTFEVFTDVNNKPRVLRMELEEKIEKLAKWLNGTDVNLPEWQFSKMLHSPKIKFTDHSILRIVQILGRLGNWRRALQVVQWLHSREHLQSYKSRYIYTTVLSVLGKAGRPVEALNVFHSMRKQLSSYPDMAAYHCISVTLGQAGYLKELFDVIDCMRSGPEQKQNKEILEKWDPCLEPDLVVYNAVLNACVRRKNWEGAFWVLQQLKQQGMQPSNTTYGLVMEVMLTCGKYKLVHEFFHKVDKSSVLNALTYRVLVNTLWKEGKTEEAVLAVQDMERRGIVGSASLYYDLARCLCSAGRCQDALVQVDKICKVARKPLVVTYTGLIKACFDSGSIENGMYVYNHMTKFCSPNLVTYNMMLKAYVGHRMFNDAKGLFWKILEGAEVGSKVTGSGQKLMADSITFNTMLEACAAEEKWDEFECVYQRMLHHGYQFDVKRHLRLVLEASKAGKGHVVETAYSQLVQSGRIPPISIVKERFCYKLQQADCLGAIACVRDLAGYSVAFSKKVWLELFKNNSQRFQRETLVRLVDSLVTEGDQAHQALESSCRELISSNVTIDSVVDVPI
ncbi:pentatricopeptide repeat-containing protein At1g30610, chloroplastic [Nymphaea colorata]|nr:pentatricopeptide repeat-containing protein At1g30610, chloroplastic [Nymphaea colorata]